MVAEDDTVTADGSVYQRLREVGQLGFDREKFAKLAEGVLLIWLDNESTHADTVSNANIEQGTMHRVHEKHVLVGIVRIKQGRLDVLPFDAAIERKHVRH